MNECINCISCKCVDVTEKNGYCNCWNKIISPHQDVCSEIDNRLDSDNPLLYVDNVYDFIK